VRAGVPHASSADEFDGLDVQGVQDGDVWKLMVERLLGESCDALTPSKR